MKPELQRIAIAEACGWKWDEKTIFDPAGKLTQTRRAYDPNWEDWYDRLLQVIPDYLNDLNAMHDAEETLTDLQHRQFRRFLVAVCHGPDSLVVRSRKLVSSTAAQRAEALLKTLNLWKV